MSEAGNERRLEEGELLRLKRWNTPAIYNGWEQVTRCDSGRDGFNLEETRDFMPQMGPMVGYAVTCVIRPGDAGGAVDSAGAWGEFRAYVASVTGPKVVVVQDLDKPLTYGAAWGEVNGSIHRALGCVGAIIDGGVRDIEELRDVGFKVLAKRLCVGHAFAVPLRWGCGVEVFGRRVEPGQLIHADQHGFLAVPFGEERGLLEATAFMDELECRHLISRARGSAGKGVEEILEGLEEGGACFSEAVRNKYGRRGEH